MQDKLMERMAAVADAAMAEKEMQSEVRDKALIGGCARERIPS